jgi:bacillolysin/neutral peptidase B
MASLDEETAARLYLGGALESDDFPAIFEEDDLRDSIGFRRLGVSRVSETRNRLVKLRQTLRGLPVFGSLVTVELSAGNYLRSIEGRLVSPPPIDLVAKVSPREARERVSGLSGREPAELEDPPELLVFFDEGAGRWRLVYLFEEVAAGPEVESLGLGSFDCFIDAHDNELVARMPRVPALVEEARDPAGNPVEIRFIANQGARFLVDEESLVSTHDFDFDSLLTQSHRLPGPLVRRGDPQGWDPIAVAAHANGTRMARYLSEVHGRVGVNNRRRRYQQVIRCVQRPGDEEWHNAHWAGRSAVYGQRREGGRLVSYAEELDVVAHELFHGVIASQPRLAAVGETGALNESYADLFAALVVNRGNADPRTWSWEIGSDDESSEGRRRDLSDPARFGQPAHMDEFRVLPIDAANDFGGVHLNNGIHSRAAFLVLTAASPQGGLLFPVDFVARLFYLAVTERLGPTARFSDSRRAVTAMAMSLVPQDPLRDHRLAAVARAFDEVGIMA